MYRKRADIIIESDCSPSLPSSLTCCLQNTNQRDNRLPPTCSLTCISMGLFKQKMNPKEPVSGREDSHSWLRAFFFFLRSFLSVKQISVGAFNKYRSQEFKARYPSLLLKLIVQLVFWKHRHANRVGGVQEFSNITVNYL